MNILAIDTSSTYCSLAIITKQGLYTRHDERSNTQSVFILSEIDSLLKEANLEKSLLNYIIFGAGPGSFTGVRLAISVANALADALSIPCFGFSCTLIMAYEEYLNNSKPKISVVQDAKRNELFLASYDFSSYPKIEVLKSDSIIPIENFNVELEDDVCGTGCQYLDIATQPLSTQLPNAKHLANLARDLIQNNLHDKLSMQNPNYVRNKVTY